MENNIVKDRILPIYKREIESCLLTLSSNTESKNSKKQALGDLAVLQLAYEYMENHETASGTCACKGCVIPFTVLIKVEEIRKS